MKKILAITSIRSDYDLMSSLYRLLDDSPDFEFKLLVSGAHLSSTYGMSVDLIEKDGFDILLAIETLIDSNTRQSRLKTASLFLQASIDSVARYDPDLILLAGDREDVVMGALLGGFLEIPTMHFYGGDHVQDGHIDNPVRHATSKLATVHMVCLDEHRQRLLCMGEAPERIFTIGSIALDRFVKHQAKSKQELAKQLSLNKGFDDFATVIFHPVAEERDNCHIIFENILNSLKKRGIKAFVGTPNTDPGNRDILAVVEQYRHDSNFFFYKNLDRDTFLSVYKNSRFLIGNSSSGILESASVPIPAINVGLRQQGRRANPNVLFCGTDQKSIEGALDTVVSFEFLTKVKAVENIYGQGHSARKAYEILRDFDFKRLVFKKEDPLELVREASGE
jgi:UDP-N-acetylglucosamine 2-epimerase (non-hydrolysing)/GDP/UDP-N,N'-diacetylbacillosamine 2-epimerase (hydrolysing)